MPMRLLTVSGTYQNYQNGVVSNRLTEGGGGGGGVGVKNIFALTEFGMGGGDFYQKTTPKLKNYTLTN
jgi:hypothetical protein